MLVPQFSATALLDSLYFYADLRSIVFIQQHRGWGTRAKNLGLERLVLAHRWLWPVLQKRYTWVFRTWWKTLKRQYTSNKSFFWRILPNVKLRGFSQSWIFNMRVSERLRSLVFIQKLFSKEFSSYPGELQCTGFHLQYNFGYGNLKCSRHKPLNLSTSFYSPGLAVLTLFRCCLQHLSLAFARCASGFVDSIFEYIWIYLHLFEYIWAHGKTSKDIKRHGLNTWIPMFIPLFFWAIVDGFAEMSGCVWFLQAWYSRLIIRGVTWRAVPAEFKTGMCEMKSWGLRFCGVFLGTLVRDRCGEMRAVTWRAVLAEFKTGMCEMKSRGLRFCGVFGNGFRAGLRKCPV